MGNVNSQGGSDAAGFVSSFTSGLSSVPIFGNLLGIADGATGILANPALLIGGAVVILVLIK
jgi:hypothetical protein